MFLDVMELIINAGAWAQSPALNLERDPQFSSPSCECRSRRDTFMHHDGRMLATWSAYMGQREPS